ncbi:phage tail assembly chaperone G [Pantoea phytobeneficialis]|uniref:Phage minor tail protein G n=1 Tax=Pantoea phytobeneficialis TaxID=2052056 RepID=A0AAP9H481_9GAMM|nr:phage minor tail protein G [Pantoea phytobeneficialis]MDO6406257.1 phage minor tail protein G [Pantoea phytobeneficialis]QGR06248.1 phage minor tail protein G [Pantoea phytobeneficialis]
MFLKTEEFSFAGASLTLYELSALQRIEYLSYLAEMEKKLPPAEGDPSVRHAELVAMGIRSSAMLVAMSVWHEDRKGPPVPELYDEILATWPVTALGEADRQIKILSGMVPPDDKEQSDSEGAPVSEAVTAEKS